MPRPHPALIDLAAGRPMAGHIGDVDGFLRSAAEHKMQGLLWNAVERNEIALPKDAELLLAKWNLQIQARHRRLWTSLEGAVRRLEDVGLQVATAKGVTAEARWYPAMGTRPAADVDLLLRPSDIPRANEAVALFEPNHQLVNRAARLARSGDLQSIDIKDDLGSDIDVHFDILKFEVATRQSLLIWDRTQPFQFPSGQQVRVLDPETSLIHFLLHLNKDRFSHLLGFSDVARLVQQETLDWDFIDRFLRTEGFETHLYLALDTVFDTLNLPAPAHVAPAGWRAAAWRRLWPETVQLGGDLGRMSHHRRQYWIGATSRGRTPEAARRWVRRIFPTRTLLDYYHPGEAGPYLWRLGVGRLHSASRRRMVIRRLDQTRAGWGDDLAPRGKAKRV